MPTFLQCKQLGVSNIEEYFKKIDTKGFGGYGIVYKAEVTPEGKAMIGHDLPSHVAVKSIKLGPSIKSEMLINEIDMLKHHQLPHGIKYYGCFENSSYLYIIMELIDGKDLFDYINDRVPVLTMDEKILIAREIALGINEFHDKGLIHRDIKPENVMVVLKPVLRVVIIDYGFICDMARPTSGCFKPAGTLGYHDVKEVKSIDKVKTYNSMKLSDWWSFGQLLSMLLFDTYLYNQHTKKYSILPADPRNTVPPVLYNVLFDLTDPNREQTERPQEAVIISALINASKQKHHKPLKVGIPQKMRRLSL